MKGMDGLAYCLSPAPNPPPNLIHFEPLIRAQQQHLRPPHRKTVGGFQALAQDLSFFIFK
jgi:hypothetical protein